MQAQIDKLKKHIEQCNIVLANMVEKDSFDLLRESFPKLNNTIEKDSYTLTCTLVTNDEEEKIESDVIPEIVERLESNRVYPETPCRECSNDMNHEWYIVCDRKQYLNKDGSERKWLMYACYNCEKWGDDAVMANHIALDQSPEW